MPDDAPKAGFDPEMAIADTDQDCVQPRPSALESQLRQEKERFELAAAAVDCLIYDWSVETNHVERTEGLTRLFGYSLAESAPTLAWWKALVHPDDIQTAEKSVAAALAVGNRYSVEYRVRHCDGTYCHVLDRGIVLRNADGQPIRVVGTTTDISAQKQAETERDRLLTDAERQAQQLRGLTEAALRMNSMLPLEDVLQTVTDQARLIIGAHQAVTSFSHDQNWAQALISVSLSDKYAQWRDYEEQTDGTGIYTYVCHFNQPMRMSQAELEAHPGWKGFGKAADRHPPMRGWLAAPLTGRDGHNIGLIQLSDKYEGEFTESDESILVQLAQMASVAIENARLYAAEQSARTQAVREAVRSADANRIKDEFLAVLSHELRSPLNPILGWAKLLRTRKFDSATTDRALETIERNAKLQTQLIEDLLDVSRILQGKLVLNTATVDLTTAVRSAIETVQLAAEAKTIALYTEFQPALKPVTGDPNRLQQVVWNLLSNAIKFTSSGGRVAVQLGASSPSAALPVPHALLRICDTGQGISADFLPYLFDSFRQADSSTTRHFGGLGLGLAIARHLVELHGGTIWAESPGEGQGATFSVALPFAVAATAPATPPTPASLPTAQPLSAVRALVVDDETDTRELIVFVLKQAGAAVVAASSAQEALRVLSRPHQLNLLLSDIAMPGVDGYELIRQVRTQLAPPSCDLPAIALTAYAGELNQKRALQAGFQQHLSKPIEPQQLTETIASLLAALPR